MSAARQRRLSPREEMTLRRIAFGHRDLRLLDAVHVMRLVRRGLVIENRGALELTVDGRRRCDGTAGSIDGGALTP
ncbi:hypothetical protein [Reyranella sp.]|uniref:hypothetical protein n=1 Tax=Reyranella sp. TaxID=1929291 RepID=UPI003BABAA55